MREEKAAFWVEAVSLFVFHIICHIIFTLLVICSRAVIYFTSTFPFLFAFAAGGLSFELCVFVTGWRMFFGVNVVITSTALVSPQTLPPDTKVRGYSKAQVSGLYYYIGSVYVYYICI